MTFKKRLVLIASIILVLPLFHFAVPTKVVAAQPVEGPVDTENFLSGLRIDTNEKYDKELSEKLRGAVNKESYAKQTTKELPVAVNPIDVGTWADLETAFNGTYDQINLIGDLTATKNLTLNRKVVINGNHHSLIMLTRYIAAGNDMDLTLSNLSFSGTSGNLIQSTNTTGKLTLVNDISSLPGSTSGIAIMTGGDILLDGVNLTYDNTNNVPGIESRNLTITNKSVVNSEAEKFFGSNSSRNAGGIVRIDGQSKVRTHSMKGVTGNSRGQAWDIRNTVHFFIEGEGTEFDVKGDGNQRVDYGGILVIYGADSTLNLSDKALMNVRGTKATAVLMQSVNGEFNVSGNSILNIVTEDDNGYDRGAALRFRLQGNQSFNISGESQINILKGGGTGQAAAIRMFHGNNNINVSEASDFYVYNGGDGRPGNPALQGGNQGILYTDALARTRNGFKVEGKDSNVSIVAEYGTAIASSGEDMDIVVGEGTYFNATGNPRLASDGIFTGRNVNVTIDSPNYFDFTNKRIDGGNIYKVSSGIMKTINSDLAVWKTGKGVDVSNNPTRTFILNSFELSGVDYGTIASTSDPEIIAGFNLDGGMTEYTRISANNQTAIIDELRVPTNADKYIWAHASMPEGKHDPSRDAFTDEVKIEVDVNNADGSFAYKTTGAVYQDPETLGKAKVYEGDLRSGMIRLPVQSANEFLEQGQTFKVVKAWRGDITSAGKAHVSPADQVVDTVREVLDVVPPIPTKITTDPITNATKQIAGTDSEAQATARVGYSGEGVDNLETVVGNDNKWQLDLPKYLDKEEEINVYLEDKAGKHVAAELITNDDGKEVYDQVGLIQPPKTNNDNGNINPYEDYPYHDAVFPGVAKIKVVDVLPDAPIAKKSYTSNSQGSPKVGDVVTYKLVATNDKPIAKETNWKDVKIVDTLPVGMNFDPEKSAVTLNGNPLAKTDYEYDEVERTLTFSVGDLASQASATVTFEAKITVDGIGKTVTNKIKAEGDSPRDKVFVEGVELPDAAKETYSAEADVSITGEIIGVLELVSAPDNMDFGKVTYDSKIQTLSLPTLDAQLIVSDSRGHTGDGWTLYAKVETDMTHDDDDTVKLVDGFHYMSDGEDITLNNGNKPVYSSDVSEDKNISATWGIDEEDDGLKLVVNPKISKVEKGSYTGKIMWQLMEGTP